MYIKRNTKTIIQISDIHIDKAKVGGIDTILAMKNVIKSVVKKNIDAIIITGDLVHKANDDNYKILQDIISEISTDKVFIITGNHDDDKLVSKYFGKYQHKDIVLGSWHIIFVNTVVSGATYGIVSKDELASLAKLLSSSKAKYIMLAMHHPAVSMQSVWDDKLSLNNASDLFNEILSYKKVKAITWGHTHEYKKFDKNGLSFYSCPSVAKQFSEPYLDSAYMIFNLLENGNIKHKVICT